MSRSMFKRQWSVGLILALGLGGPGGCSAPAERSPGDASTSGAGEVRVTPDVVYGHKAGMALTFDVYRPDRANGAGVVFVNSGGFVSGQFRQYEAAAGGRCRFLPADSLRLEREPGEVVPLLAQVSFAPLLDAGFTLFDVRHGGSPWFRLPAIVSDVRDAVRFIQDHAGNYGVDPARLGIWGGSAGGYLALDAAFARDSVEDAAGRPLIRSVAVYYPAGYDFVADAEAFPQVLASLPALQVGSAILDSLSLRHLISSQDPPTLVVYGTEDFPFITGAADSICAALSRDGVLCRRVAIPGVGHEFRTPEGYDAAAGGRASRETVAWFRETLGGA